MAVGTQRRILVGDQADADALSGGTGRQPVVDVVADDLLHRDEPDIAPPAQTHVNRIDHLVLQRMIDRGQIVFAGIERQERVVLPAAEMGSRKQRVASPQVGEHLVEILHPHAAAAIVVRHGGLADRRDEDLRQVMVERPANPLDFGHRTVGKRIAQVLRHHAHPIAQAFVNDEIDGILQHVVTQPVWHSADQTAATPHEARHRPLP